MLYHLLLSGIFFFLGGGEVNLGPGFFFFGGGGCFNPKGFVMFPFLPPFDHPCHLKSGVLRRPPPPGLQGQDGCQSNRSDFDH